jgi:COP9 signalosome complex subunit 5
VFTIENANAVEAIDPSRDALYNYDKDAENAIRADKPWRRDPHYFKSVRISALALLKMVMHARSGGNIEIMGMMMGYVVGDTFIVTDAVRLPVEGTETRVNAQSEADEYVVKYFERLRESGRLENAVGWYHSHPGYGCWLSGIDVGTQHNHQMYNDPFLAVVIDPERTMTAGKVEIGAFRTYPEEFKPSSGSGNDLGVPMEKMQDFGMHADRYYSLDVSTFKSTLDNHLLSALWNKYWVSTLSANPLLSNREYGTKQIVDLASKIKEANRAQADSRATASLTLSRRSKDIDAADEKLIKVAKASAKIQVEQRSGLMATTVRNHVFSAKDPSK